jgi:hypothetical protein
LSEFAAHLLSIEADMKFAQEIILERACKMIEKAAKHAIGTYEFNWPQLAADTQAERARLGPPNEPLLRRGDLKNSISHYVDKAEPAGYVGSTSEIAKRCGL